MPTTWRLPLLLIGLSVFARAVPLEQAFRSPPREATPWAYWVWLRTPTTPPAMTKDLEEMKAKGITGFILYDCGAGGMEKPNQKMVLADKAFLPVATHDFVGQYSTELPLLPTWSPAWQQEIKFVAAESNRLGLDFCLAMGLAGCAAPDLDPHYAEQQLVWSSTEIEGGKEVDVVLPLPAPRGKNAQLSPELTAAYLDVATLAVPIRTGPLGATRATLDLSLRLGAEGQLRWRAPPGKWQILRFGQLPTGAKNMWGLFCDHLSQDGFDHFWAKTMAPLLDAMTLPERSALRSVEDDSWEAGEPTWTRSFPEEFRARRGYDIIPLLPILAGVPAADATGAAEFRRDYALTISDLEVNNYYARMETVCREHGLTLYSEANGPNYHGIDVTQSGLQVDHNMGEFWMPSPHRPTLDRRFLARDAATSNHLRGEPMTMCESFTSVGPMWTETPFSMKACADQAFCDGVNRICIHNYSHSPLLDAQPGDVYFAGTHVNRNVTWWNVAAEPFFTYLSRCSALLQRGTFVADALFYIGDGIDQAAPRKEVYPTLGSGYDYDRTDATALIKWAHAEGDHIVLSTGMRYRVLILPNAAPMSLPGLEKIAQLVDGGAAVVGPRPTGPSGRMQSPEDRARFETLVSRLWGTGNRRLISDRLASQVLRRHGIEPDFSYTGLSSHGELDWIHRSEPDAEIYFVSSRWFDSEHVSASFRVAGRQPELWDPVTGEIKSAQAFRQADGRTAVPLDLHPCGSVFVVFRRAIPITQQGSAQSNAPTSQLDAPLAGAWKVSFDPKWGGPAEPVEFPRLMDWSQHPDPRIRYYSGTAVYRRTFDLYRSMRYKEHLWLDLGEVCEVASVRLNGKDLGVIWTQPARVEITGQVKSGVNHLEITVVNLWPNRLIRDAGLPAEQRLTHTNMHYYTAESPLLTSGLIGPVRLALEH